MAFVIQNSDALAVSQLRKDALEIVQAGYEAIDTRSVLTEDVKLEGDTLTIANHTYALAPEQKVWVAGAGKCAIAGAAALEEILGERIAGGVIIDVADEVNCLPFKKIQCFLGTHPKPSAVNVDASKHLVGTLEGLGENDIVIILVSGGGSTLLCLPEEPVTYETEVQIFNELTDAAATIQEMDTLRKHLSLARGGGLAKAAYPARVIGLIFSDVPGNDVSFISSGPTVQDETTIKDAQSVIEKYNVSALAGMPLLETSKDAKYFARVHNELLVTNIRALDAMARALRARGYTPRIVTDRFSGEARRVADDVIAALADAEPATALLYGGESTVTLGEHAGKGGRNQELALAALAHIKPNEIIVAFSSDGHDNTDYAGALCDNITKEHAAARALSVEEYLRSHRSYDFFTVTGDALLTGYTGANVSDLIIGITARLT